MPRLLSQLLLVGAGGALGSMLRFLVGGWVHRALPGASFPVGTFAVNLLGCLAIGLLTGLADLRGVLGPGARLFLLVGLLGGFTTFSTFAYETLALAQEAEAAKAIVNAAGQVILGFAAAWAGYLLPRFL